MKRPNNYLVKRFREKVCKNMDVNIPLDGVKCVIWKTQYCYGCVNYKSRCKYLLIGHCNHPELLHFLKLAQIFEGP